MGCARPSRLVFPTVVTVNDYTRDQDFSGAALVLDHLGEPEDPFRVLAGTVGSHRYFTLELARQIHAQVAPVWSGKLMMASDLQDLRQRLEAHLQQVAQPRDPDWSPPGP
jgi:hypothetical protein